MNSHALVNLRSKAWKGGVVEFVHRRLTLSTKEPYETPKVSKKNRSTVHIGGYLFKTRSPS